MDKQHIPKHRHRQRWRLPDNRQTTTNTIVASQQVHLTVLSELSIPRVLFGDLHVHSDDTVGTESSAYNFSYGREIAGLDVLGLHGERLPNHQGTLGLHIEAHPVSQRARGVCYFSGNKVV